jgi:glutamine synthetase
MAEELGKFADVLEKADNFDEALHELVADTFRNHQRIIFSGNGYSDEWKEEAARRGLSNFPSTAECLPTYLEQKNIELVTKHKIFTEAEFHARYAIYTEAYNKIVRIEARTTVDMAMRQILPAVLHYARHLSEGLVSKQALGLSSRADKELLSRISTLADSLYDGCEHLKALLEKIPADEVEAATYFHKFIIPAMDAVRNDADALEELTDKSYWPFPTYSDLLYY